MTQKRLMAGGHSTFCTFHKDLRPSLNPGKAKPKLFQCPSARSAYCIVEMLGVKLKDRGEVQFFQLQQDLNPFVKSENKASTKTKVTTFAFRVKIYFST